MWYIVIVLHNFLFTKFPTVFDGFLGEFYRLPFNEIALNEFVFLDCASLSCAASKYSCNKRTHSAVGTLGYDALPPLSGACQKTS